ncbi:unnamed protein product [Brachionus calyciflorus]|uniref:Prenylcysteine lyase domain-containing protein n=1 Tax=Brachionus calyciflorus TaxID=104777 RepID=A0A813M0Q4_9BILA|nr:unnamed protein product [Brachionus calyciflorus]
MSLSHYQLASNSSSYESLINQFAPILTNRIQVLNESKYKNKIKIAIIGSGLGGCAAAYFLENVFNAMNNKEIEIHIYEKETELGNTTSKFQYNGLTYDVNPIKVDESQNYMNNFIKNSSCKLSNDIDENILTALFDSSGIVVQKYGQFNKIDNLKILLVKFGIRNALKFLKIFYELFKYRTRIYSLQDQGYTFDSIEKLVRKINPLIFTLSQQTFSENIKKTNSKLIEELSILSCLDELSQTNRVPGLVGCNSLISFFSSNFIKDDLKKILKYLLNNCFRTKLYLNRHVKSISYDTKNNQKNVLIYSRKSQDFKKLYDYVVVAFPLTKNLQNFNLDILYRDFLDCELVKTNSYIIDGVFTMLSPKNEERRFKLYTQDPSLKFNSIKTCSPIEGDQKNSILYSVSSLSDLNESIFDSVFEKGWKCVRKMSTFVAPLYKKVRYSHTPFPQVIIDDVKRSRVFYLNGLHWLACSKESNCISARNIAFLIARKEFGEKMFSKNFGSVAKYSEETKSCTKKLNNFFLITFFTSVCTFLLYKNLNF